MSDFREEYQGDIEALDCPLCGEKKAMQYRHIPDSPGSPLGTHVWACEYCPAVLFEYWEPQDADNIRRESAEIEAFRV